MEFTQTPIIRRCGQKSTCYNLKLDLELMSKLKTLYIKKTINAKKMQDLS